MMQILSLGFHATNLALEKWENYLKLVFYKKIEENWALDKYILSLVSNDMIEEGRNYNLQIFFANDEASDAFTSRYLDVFQAEITGLFGQEVMLFVSKLHVIDYK
jgi:Domain of unknown function (DUF4286)